MRLLATLTFAATTAISAEISLHPAFPFPTIAHTQLCSVEARPLHVQPIPLIANAEIISWRAEFPKSAGVFITRGDSPHFFHAMNTVVLRLTPSAREKLVAFNELPLAPRALVLRVDQQDLGVIHIDQQTHDPFTGSRTALGNELSFGVDPDMNLFTLLGAARFDPGLTFTAAPSKHAAAP